MNDEKEMKYSNTSVKDSTLSVIRKVSREINKHMPRGGRQGTPKGKRGYTRKTKHKGNDDQ